METLSQILILFLLLLIGYISKKFKVISNEMNRDMSNLILYIALPALTIISLSSYDFSKDMLIKSGKLLAISCGVYTLSILFSYLIPKLYGIEGTSRDVFQFMVVFSNVGFMGFPIVNAIFGSKGIFYTALYNLPFSILIWTFGVMVMSRPSRGESKETLNDKGGLNIEILLNPGTLSVLIGFIMFLTSIKLPGPIFQAFKILGDTSTPLSMIFVGSILADIEINKIFTNKDVFTGSIVRLIALPLIVLMLLKPFGLDPIMIGIPVIITAMPVAANCAIFASKYGNDYHMASQTVFISTLLSIISIPLIVTLL